MTRLPLAEVTSGVGALVLGIGLGAIFAAWVAPAAGMVALAGVLVHGFGMWDKHRLEARTQAHAGPLMTALYWVCWLLLAGGVVYLVLLQLGMHHVPAAQEIFEIGALSMADCVLTLLVALGPVTAIELWKLVQRWPPAQGRPDR